MHLHHRHGSHGIAPPKETVDELRMWHLRMLVPLGGHRGFLLERGFHNDDVAQILGLGHWIDDVPDFWPEAAAKKPTSQRREIQRQKQDYEYDRRRVLVEMRKLHRAAELKPCTGSTTNALHVNTCRIAHLVGLSETEIRLLKFAVTLHSDALLAETSELLGMVSTARLVYCLSLILGIAESSVREALSSKSALCQSGLITLERSGPSSITSKLELLSTYFADHITNAETDPLDLLRDTVAQSPSATLELSDFDHISRPLALLQPYLRKSLLTKKKGINVFFHGPPGTGKTELARTIAKTLGCELLQVSSEDEDGDPISATGRLRALRAAQGILANRSAMLVFDEAEDVFNDGWGLGGQKSTAQTRKAWINRVLEEAPVPTLWLSNNINNLDTAFIRRFDMIIELPIPPKVQRQRILTSICDDVLDSQTVAFLAESEHLAPAVVARATNVIRNIDQLTDPQYRSEAAKLLISSTLEAQGHASVSRNDPNQLPTWYDHTLLNANVDLHGLALGLKRTRQGRACFYGPSGTGKTAYARWLSSELDRPLIVRKGSDLMSMWLGESEKQIARAFRDAERAGAVLLIDEVDGFLQDRRGAHRSWEVTQVNEMLTQMESFGGIFIASTNLMDGLDQAALRRFDLKVKFDYLKSPQAWALFNSLCQSLKLPSQSDALHARLDRLKNLTPGDFAAMGRQHRFSPFATACDLLEGLTGECEFKESAQKAIGFV